MKVLILVSCCILGISLANGLMILPSTLNTFYSDLSNIGATQMLQLLQSVQNILVNGSTGITSLQSIPQSTIQLFELQAANALEHDVEQTGTYLENEVQSFFQMNKTGQLQLIQYFINLTQETNLPAMLPMSPISNENALFSGNFQPVISPIDPPINPPIEPPPPFNPPIEPPFNEKLAQSAMPNLYSNNITSSANFVMPSYVVPPSLQ